MSNVSIRGQRGFHPMDRAFVDWIAKLTPTGRRLAIALACAHPWQDDPTQLPDCYRRELRKARYDANEEGVALSELELERRLRSKPISVSFLTELADVTAARRRLALAMACTGHWEMDEAAPQCFQEELHHAGGEAHQEYRFWAAQGWVEWEGERS